MMRKTELGHGRVADEPLSVTRLRAKVRGDALRIAVEASAARGASWPDGRTPGAVLAVAREFEAWMMGVMAEVDGAELPGVEDSEQREERYRWYATMYAKPAPLTDFERAMIESEIRFNENECNRPKMGAALRKLLRLAGHDVP